MMEESSYINDSDGQVVYDEAEVSEADEPTIIENPHIPTTQDNDIGAIRRDLTRIFNR
jgi:hypothetical protein